MEVELQLIIVLLSFYNTRHLAYSRSWLQEEEDKRVDNPLKERVLGSMHNYIIMSNSRKDFPSSDTCYNLHKSIPTSCDKSKRNRR